MTYTYRCIGKGITDSNGVAHITHDCSGNQLVSNGYKGVGAGLMDFIASTDAPADISDGSFQSEIFELMDLEWLDYGTQSNHNSNYVNTGLTVSYDSTGTTVTNEATGNKYLLCDLNHTQSSTASDTYDFFAPCKIEMDVIAITGVPMLYVVNSNSENAHKDITATGTLEKNVSLTGNLSIGIRLGEGASITFKDFKITPI